MNSQQGSMRWLSPKFVAAQIMAFDGAAEEERRASQASDAEGRIRVWKLLTVACLCLLLVHYGKYSANLTALVQWAGDLTGNNQLYQDYRKYEFRELLGYLWWGSINLLGFMIIPMVMAEGTTQLLRLAVGDSA